MKWYEKKKNRSGVYSKVVDRYKVQKYLNDTDWYVIRLQEIGTDIPQDVLDTRALCRELL